MTHPEIIRPVKRTLTSIVMNESGVLARIVGLFAARAYNIENLSTRPLTDERYSRVTITTSGTVEILNQIICHYRKMVPVISVGWVANEGGPGVIEGALIRLMTKGVTRLQAAELLRSFGAVPIFLDDESVVFKAVGTPIELEQLRSACESFGSVEFERTAPIAL
jgi:acetolactate synthase I/III small subunit